MAQYHVYSQTVADGTATSVVRPSDWNSAHVFTQTLSGNTAGSSTVAGTNLVWAGGDNITLSATTAANVATISINAPASSSLVAGNNITLSTNGSTISVVGPAAGGVTLSRWWGGLDKYISSLTSHNATSLNGSMFIQYVEAPCYVTGTQIGQIIGFTAATSHNSANTLTISQSFGIYSRTGPSATQLTLASSGSTTFAATWSSNTTSNAFGLRELYCPFNINMTPGEYFIANVLSVSATNGGSAASFSRFGAPIQTAGGGAAAGFTGGTNVTDAAFFPAQGVWNATTAAMPNSLGISAITQTGTALMYANQYFEIRA